MAKSREMTTYVQSDLADQLSGDGCKILDRALDALLKLTVKAQRHA